MPPSNGLRSCEGPVGSFTARPATTRAIGSSAYRAATTMSPKPVVSYWCANWECTTS